MIYYLESTLPHYIKQNIYSVCVLHFPGIRDFILFPNNQITLVFDNMIME